MNDPITSSDNPVSKDPARNDSFLKTGTDHPERHKDTKSRVAIVIPTHNNELTIGSLVLLARQYGTRGPIPTSGRYRGSGEPSRPSIPTSCPSQPDSGSHNGRKSVASGRGARGPRQNGHKPASGGATTRDRGVSPNLRRRLESRIRSDHGSDPQPVRARRRPAPP